MSVLGIARIVHRGRSQLGHGPILRGFMRHLAPWGEGGHPRRVDEEQGIYRGDVTTIMGILADVNVNVEEILAYLKGDDDDEWEEEEEDDRPPNA